MSYGHAPTICDVCGSPTRIASNREVFNRAVGRIEWFVVCTHPRCGAYARTGPDSLNSIEKMATPRLRRARIEAHKVFDTLWKGSYQRTRAYCWLAEQMGMSKEECHIRFFDEEQCLEVIKLVQGLKENPIRKEIEHVQAS